MSVFEIKTGGTHPYLCFTAFILESCFFDGARCIFTVFPCGVLVVWRVLVFGLESCLCLGSELEAQHPVCFTAVLLESWCVF